MEIDQNFRGENICKFITSIYIFSLYAFKNQKIYIELIWICILSLYFLEKKIKFNQYLLWSSCFLVIVMASNLWTFTPKDTLYATRGVLEIFIIGNIFSMFIDNEEKLKFIFKCFVVAGIFLSIRIILTNSFDMSSLQRLGNELYNANSIGLQLSVSTICSLHLSITNEKKKPMYFILILIFIILIFLTGSRKAFLFSTLGCLMICIFNIKSKRNLIFAIPIAILGMYCFYYFIMNNVVFYDILGVRIEKFINLITNNGDIDASSQIRMQLIDVGRYLWKGKPWIGYGIQSFSKISGFQIYSHNNYIELLVGIGAIGTCIYYSLYVFLIVKLGKLVFQGAKLAIPLYVIIILLTINEVGFVSYGEEIYQIILAIGVSCIKIFNDSNYKLSKHKEKKGNNDVFRGRIYEGES